MQSPVVPEYVLQTLRIERERTLALNAYIGRYNCRPCRPLPVLFAKPIAGLGRLLLVTGHRLETAAGFQLAQTAWPLQYQPCEGCGD